MTNVVWVLFCFVCLFFRRPLHWRQNTIWWCRASCPRMAVDILTTNCDQCRSTVQCCFTSTETVRLIRTEIPGRPPRLSHSSWTLTKTKQKHCNERSFFVFVLSVKVKIERNGVQRPASSHMEVTPHLWRQVNVENLSQLGIRRGELSCWPDDCNRPGINRLWHCCHSRNSVFRFKFKSARRYKTNYLIWLVFALSNDFDRFRLLDKAWFQTAIFPVINLTKMPFSCSLLAPGKHRAKGWLWVKLK